MMLEIECASSTETNIISCAIDLKLEYEYLLFSEKFSLFKFEFCVLALP